MNEDDEKPTALQPIERTDLARAGDIDLGLSQKASLLERGRLWAHEQLSKSQEKVLTAKVGLNSAAALFLRSQEHLQEEIERNHHWKANPDVIRNRIRDEFDAEEEERTIRRRERQERLAEQDRKAKEAEARCVAAEAEIELERRRREAKLSGDVRPSETPDEAFRRQVEQVLNHGSTGRFMLIAEEGRAELIAKRGGEEHLTNEDRERIELAFEIARRRQESKG